MMLCSQHSIAFNISCCWHAFHLPVCPPGAHLRCLGTSMMPDSAASAAASALCASLLGNDHTTLNPIGRAPALLGHLDDARQRGQRGRQRIVRVAVGK